MIVAQAKPRTKRRWFQFSLSFLLGLMLLACIAFAWAGRERRHALAVSELSDLGAHVSEGADGRIVYLWRTWHDDGMSCVRMEYFVTNNADIERVIRCLKSLKRFSVIVLTEGQSEIEPALRQAFPAARIEFGMPGVI